MLNPVSLQLRVGVDVGSRCHSVAIGLSDVSMANWYSRGDRELDKAAAVLFPSEIAQRGRMRDHTRVKSL